MHNLAVIVSGMGNFDDALNYFNEALLVQQKCGDKKAEGITLNNLSWNHLGRGDYAMALDYLMRAAQIQQEIGDLQNLTQTLLNIALAHNVTGNPKQALESLQQAQKIAQQTGNAYALQFLEELVQNWGLDNKTLLQSQAFAGSKEPTLPDIETAQ